MKKNARENISFKKFLDEFKNHPLNYSSFICLFIFLLFLPGQNYYQTLSVVKKEPVLFPAPFALPSTAPYPFVKGQEAVPEVSAQSAILIDVDSQVVVFQKNPNEKLLPASTAKIMTALVALENYDQNSVLTAWESLIDQSTDAALMRLKTGDRVSVKNLLYGLLLNSGADAAETLSQNFPGGRKAFIQEMNKRAVDLHLNNTRFVNETGLDEKGQYTTVLDLARLSTFAMNNSLFRKIVSTSEYFATNFNGEKKYYLKNINNLLGVVWGMDGIKTGYTQEAGECLVATAQRNGRRLLSVVLKSQNRFLETQNLLEWGFRNLEWKSL